jgi:DNA-binding winged helix-turn-helix (wHTH) protein
MSPRVLEILDRLESIDLEALALRKELREVLEEKKHGIMIPPDLSVFKEKTCLLLTEFWNAPNHVLTHEDIRLDVICNEEASDAAVRNVIKRARNEMKNHHDCHFEIKSIPKKGYKLEKRKLYQIVSKTSKRPKKRHKKHDTF